MGSRAHRFVVEDLGLTVVAVCDSVRCLQSGGTENIGVGKFKEETVPERFFRREEFFPDLILRRKWTSSSWLPSACNRRKECRCCNGKGILELANGPITPEGEAILATGDAYRPGCPCNAGE